VESVLDKVLMDETKMITVRRTGRTSRMIEAVRRHLLEGKRATVVITSEREIYFINKMLGDPKPPVIRYICSHSPEFEPVNRLVHGEEPENVFIDHYAMESLGLSSYPEYPEIDFYPINRFTQLIV
jgi:hypothetical protein